MTGIIFDIESNPPYTNIEILQGKTISFPLIWGGATPINVTGYDARMQIREDASSDEVIASFTVANSRVTIGTTNGLITFSMTAADSAALTPGEYFYEIEVIDSSGLVISSKELRGRCTIIAEITK